MSRSLRIDSRCGVTILEVLFAIGIVIVGLLGIASILPLAGRQASDSNRAAEAQALGEDWYREFITRGMNATGSWQRYLDNLNTPTFFGFAKGFTDQTFSAGSSGPTTIRPIGKTAICIDPMFYTDRDVRKLIAANAFYQANTGLPWYRPAVFPYYQDGYNPTVDPFYPIGNASSLPWQDQPRMLRVTLGSPAAGPVTGKLVEEMFTSQDDLSIATEESDLSIAPTRGVFFYADPTSVTGYLPIARAATKGEYSWLATLTPNEDTSPEVETHYTLSLVVMHRRDMLFVDPRVYTQRVPGPPAPDEKPAGERLAWVLPLSGNFDGGHGGRVRLIATDGVDDKVLIGDWIMLARNIGAAPVANNVQQRYSVFRWYRVVAVDGDAVYGPLGIYAASAGYGASTDPYGLAPSDEVWVRDVVLEGPDWNFGPMPSLYPPPPNPPPPYLPLAPLVGGGTIISPTTATLMKGAIHVIERVVEVP